MRKRVYRVFSSILLLTAVTISAAEDDGYDAAMSAVKAAEKLPDAQPRTAPVPQAGTPGADSLHNWLTGFLLLCLCAGLTGSALVWLVRRLMLAARRDEVMALIQTSCRHALARDCPLNDPRCWNEEGRMRWVEQQSLPDLEFLLARHRECSRSH